MCSGRGIVATAFIPKGARFFDPAVRYHENQSPLGLESRRLYLDVAHTHTHTHRYHANKSPHGLHPNYYIEVPDGGYFEIARDSNGPFKSDTYYLNEARPDNQLVGSQQPNVRFCCRFHQVGEANHRQFEWLVLKDVPEGAELVVRYNASLASTR
eukprot:Tamp_23671.p1 GENE.Tamp_23671~~Tamp_23671.p1  ORF type:complete len:155 (-),score=11.56 Tamp_23671:507-971(-)